MKTFKADLHIHTCLSHCAELEMTPKNIVDESEKHGLNIIGICDHNSCENVISVKKCAENIDLDIIGGIEITSKEEVHVLALFDNEKSLHSMQQIIYDNLIETDDEKIYGDQVIVNEEDEVLGFNKKLLIGAVDLSIESIVNSIHELGGIAIASHVDRERFSLISQLGFIPEGLVLDALEVSNKSQIQKFSDRSLPIVTFSDAHSLKDIGRNYTSFSMENSTFDEITKSLRGEEGRKIEI
jgi:PHP family Zn ribbon phosphoesterase